MCLFCSVNVTASDPALDIATGIVVPLIAAIVVARVAWLGLQQVDRHRRSDRNGDAVQELTRMLYYEVELGTTMEKWHGRAFSRFANGAPYIAALALLDRDDVAVAHWAAAQRDLIMDQIEVCVGEIHTNEKEGTTTVGAHRATAAKIAAEGADKLIQWLAGDIPTAWFAAQLSK
jgi:hypothetical protein